MKYLNIVLPLGMIFFAPLATHAATIQIDDLSDKLSLIVDGTDHSVAPDARIANFVNRTSCGAVATCTLLVEMMSFDFTSALPSAVDFKQYTVMNGSSLDSHSISDVFFISGVSGSKIDHVTFFSIDVIRAIGELDNLTLPGGDISFRFDTTGYSASSFSPLVETMFYQDVFATVTKPGGVLFDTFQARSDVPEPGTVALVGLVITGLAASKLRQRGTSKAA